MRETVVSLLYINKQNPYPILTASMETAKQDMKLLSTLSVNNSVYL